MKTKTCTTCNGSGRKGSISRGAMGHPAINCSACGGTGRVTDNSIDYDPVTGKPTGCFPAGTLVLTPEGSHPIECLNAGDFVLSPQRDRILEHKKVLLRIDHEPQPLWTVTLNIGTEITTTSIHSFLSNSKWVTAKQLNAGDKIWTVDQQGNIQEATVLKSNISNAFAAVYNLIIEGNFTFVASGSIVHSFTYFRNTRILIWRFSQLLADLFERDRRNADLSELGLQRTV